MRTAPRHRSEHGGHPWRRTAVLVLLVLAVVGTGWAARSWPLGPQLLDSIGGTSEDGPAGRSSRAVEAVAEHPSAVTSATPAGRPQYVDLASVGLHAPVVPIHLDGVVLTPPSDPALVGWWRDGARVGSDAGTAVLTGHTVHTGGGAMDNLEQARPGDRVVVEVRGSRSDYRVVRVEVLSKDALAQRAPELFRQTGPSRLLLVTCENWDGREYASNVVVTAVPSS